MICSRIATAEEPESHPLVHEIMTLMAGAASMNRRSAAFIDIFIQECKTRTKLAQSRTLAGMYGRSLCGKREAGDFQLDHLHDGDPHREGEEP
jgi:hypothetical protein